MKKNVQILSGCLLSILLACSCNQLPEKVNKESVQKALAKDDSEMLQRFNTSISSQDKLPLDENVKNKILNISINKNIQQKVEAVLVSNPASKVTKTQNIETDESLKLDSVLSAEKLVIDNGALLFGVKDYKQTQNKLKELLASAHCEIEMEKEYASNFRMESSLTLRVEPVHFNDAFEKIKDLASILREKRIWKQDVSAQFVDLKSRINSKLNARKKLELELKSLNKTEEIMIVQRQIDSLTEELESIVHTTRALSQKTELSTITLTFYQEITPDVQQANLGNRMATAAIEGWVAFKDFLVYLSFQWPYLVIVSIFIITAFIASYNSRRQAMKYKKEQARIIQEQLNKSK